MPENSNRKGYKERKMIFEIASNKLFIMLSNKELPTTLQKATKFFSDDTTCINLVASLRWADGKPVCPKCQHTETSFLATRRIWKCKACKKQFSVKVGTIFENSPISLDKWLTVMWLLTNAKNGISSYENHRAISVTQKPLGLFTASD